MRKMSDEEALRFARAVERLVAANMEVEVSPGRWEMMDGGPPPLVHVRVTDHEGTSVAADGASATEAMRLALARITGLIALIEGK